MSDHDHVWVCADNVTDGERNHPEGYVYCSECLTPKDKKWRITVELLIEAPTATGAMDKADAMFHPEQWRGMSAKPWRDDEYTSDDIANARDDLRGECTCDFTPVTRDRYTRGADLDCPVHSPPEYQHPDE